MKQTPIAQRCGCRRPWPARAGADRGTGQRGDGRLTDGGQCAGEKALPLPQIRDLLVIGHFGFFLSRCAPMPLTLPPAQRLAGAGDGQHPTSVLLAAGSDHGAQRQMRVSDIALRSSGRISVMMRAVADHAQQFVGTGVDFGFCGVFYFSVIVPLGGQRRIAPCPPIIRDRQRWARFALPPTLLLLKLLHPRPHFISQSGAAGRCSTFSNLAQSHRGRASIRPVGGLDSRLLRIPPSMTKCAM